MRAQHAAAARTASGHLQLARRPVTVVTDTGFFIVLDTFERALASGRVGRGRAWLGGPLDIKPVLEVDREGKLVPIDRVRGRANVLPKMLEVLERKVPRGRKVRFG